MDTSLFYASAACCSEIRLPTECPTIRSKRRKILHWGTDGLTRNLSLSDCHTRVTHEEHDLSRNSRTARRRDAFSTTAIKHTTNDTFFAAHGDLFTTTERHQKQQPCLRWRFFSPLFCMVDNTRNRAFFYFLCFAFSTCFSLSLAAMMMIVLLGLFLPLAFSG